MPESNRISPFSIREFFFSFQSYRRRNFSSIIDNARLSHSLQILDVVLDGILGVSGLV